MKHITEACRYLDNAKEILKEKAQKEDRYYKDVKYVKMAGNTAYNRVFDSTGWQFVLLVRNIKDELSLIVTQQNMEYGHVIKADNLDVWVLPWGILFKKQGHDISM